MGCVVLMRFSVYRLLFAAHCPLRLPTTNSEQLLDTILSHEGAPESLEVTVRCVFVFCTSAFVL